MILINQKLVASVEALVTGDPEEDDTFCGAVNSKQHYQKVLIVVFVVLSCCCCSCCCSSLILAVCLFGVVLLGHEAEAEALKQL